MERKLVCYCFDFVKTGDFSPEDRTFCLQTFESSFINISEKNSYCVSFPLKTKYLKRNINNHDHQ